jgi:hypothetical protein
MNETSPRTGACHCGTVRYTARFVGETLTGSRCNCTICAMKGAVMSYVPLEAVTVTAGQESLACYSFNTGVAKHHFCANCGIHLFHQARSDPDKYAINVATLDGVRPYEDFPEVPVFDGQRHSSDNGGVRRQAGVLRFEPTPGLAWPKGVI